MGWYKSKFSFEAPRKKNTRSKSVLDGDGGVMLMILSFCSSSDRFTSTRLLSQNRVCFMLSVENENGKGKRACRCRFNLQHFSLSFVVHTHTHVCTHVHGTHFCYCLCFYTQHARDSIDRILCITFFRTNHFAHISDVQTNGRKISMSIVSFFFGTAHVTTATWRRVPPTFLQKHLFFDREISLPKVHCVNVCSIPLSKKKKTSVEFLPRNVFESNFF